MSHLPSSKVTGSPFIQIGVPKQEESGTVRMERILVQKIKPSLFFYYCSSYYVNSVDTTPQIGNDYPVAIKLGIKDDVQGGLSLEEGTEVAARLAKLGIDAIEISGGIPTKTAGASRSNILSREQEAYFLPYAKAVRPRVGRLPLSLVGGLRSPDLMEEIITEGWTDFVSLARPFICEPDLVAKIRAGRWDPVSCVRCDRCRAGMGKEGLRCRRDEEPSP